MSRSTWFEEFFNYYKLISLSLELSNFTYRGNHFESCLGMVYSKDSILDAINSSRLDRLNYFNFENIRLSLLLFLCSKAFSVSVNMSIYCGGNIWLNNFLAKDHWRLSSSQISLKTSLIIVNNPINRGKKAFFALRSLPHNF